jgi:hypothetical protein
MDNDFCSEMQHIFQDTGMCIAYRVTLNLVSREYDSWLLALACHRTGTIVDVIAIRRLVCMISSVCIIQCHFAHTARIPFRSLMLEVTNHEIITSETITPSRTTHNALCVCKATCLIDSSYCVTWFESVHIFLLTNLAFSV